MSVSFWSNEDETIVTDRYECCNHKGCYHCDGAGFVEFTGKRHECNMSNASARLVLEGLGLSDVDPLCGEVVPAEMPDLIRKGMRLSALESETSKYTYDAFEDGNVVDCGMDADRLKGNVGRVLELLRVAVENNWTVHYG